MKIHPCGCGPLRFASCGYRAERTPAACDAQINEGNVKTLGSAEFHARTMPGVPCEPLGLSTLIFLGRTLRGQMWSKCHRRLSHPTVNRNESMKTKSQTIFCFFYQPCFGQQIASGTWPHLPPLCRPGPSPHLTSITPETRRRPAGAAEAKQT